MQTRVELVDVFGAVIRTWQKAPPSWRRRLVTARAAPLLRRAFNRVYPDELKVFELADPLGGHRMRLHWQTQKAYVFGTFESVVIEAIQATVVSGQVAVDIGANIGYYSLLLAGRVGSLGKVIAFEPFPRNFAVLRENLALNGYENVTLENKAVADRAGAVSFSAIHADPLPSTGSIVSGPGIQVEAVSLDEYFGRRSERVGFVKIDVEGAEARVLDGMHDILRRQRPVLLVELHGFDVYGERHPALLKLSEARYAVAFLDGPGSQVHILAKPRIQPSLEAPISAIYHL